MPQQDNDRQFQNIPEQFMTGLGSNPSEYAFTPSGERVPFSDISVCGSLEKNPPMNYEDVKTPEDLAREIVEYPHLWGMHSIADKIHELLNSDKNVKASDTSQSEASANG